MAQGKIHFVGIKGVGMSALALLARDWGYRVTGSDVSEEFITDKLLRAADIPVYEGFSPEHLRERPDLVVVTGAHGGKTNPEACAAQELGIKVLSLAEAVGRLTAGKRVLAVAGTHGKTTTTALLAYLLERGGLHPSFLIGTGNVPNFGVNGRGTDSPYVVVEADEYVSDPQSDLTPRFLYLQPYALIVTSVEWDHPDVYPDVAAVRAAFSRLTAKLPPEGLLVLCDEIEGREELRAAARCRVVEYGEDYLWPIEKFPLPGRHNRLNATAAALVARELGVSPEAINEALATFAGAERRMERVGEAGGVLVYDDYAHHPTEIAATITALREQHPRRRLVVLFQSHTYSRTKGMLSEFALSLAEAEVVFLTDIFPSAREQGGDITMSDFVAAVRPHHSQVEYLPRGELLKLLPSRLRPGDVLVFLGAGDLYQVARPLLARLASATESP